MLYSVTEMWLVYNFDIYYFYVARGLIYRVSQKKVAPLRLSTIFSLELSLFA